MGKKRKRSESDHDVSRRYHDVSHGSCIPHDDLLAKVKKYLIGKGLVIISSLRATGKTLLLQLIRNEILIEGVVYFYTKFSKNVDPFVQLEEDAGISYDSRGNRWSMPQDQANQKMVLIIDNAHYQYENSNFWEGC